MSTTCVSLGTPSLHRSATTQAAVAAGRALPADPALALALE
jgi:hypothetical protein